MPQPRNRSLPPSRPDFKLVKELVDKGYRRIVGLDEVGRGAIAGPIVVGAVEILVEIDGINDSKVLSRIKRERLFKLICRLARQVKFGVCQAEEIDSLGLSRALALAYERAIAQTKADLYLTDAWRLPNLPFLSLVRGDRYLYLVSAASISAKVFRDQLMTLYDRFAPQYGWKNNVGYATDHHRRQLAEHGLSPLHRRSFLVRSDFSGKL